MMIVDWPNALMGLGVGVAVSVLYFVSLALSVRAALTSSRPAAVLLPSAVLRMDCFWRSVGWSRAAPRLSGLCRLRIGIFLVRFMAIMLARVPRPEEI